MFSRKVRYRHWNKNWSTSSDKNICGSGKVTQVWSVIVGHLSYSKTNEIFWVNASETTTSSQRQK
jgi:hypothetical protein